MLWLSLSNDYSPEERWTTCPWDWSHMWLEKFAKTKHIGDVSGTWISCGKKSAHGALTDVACVREICYGISFPPVFYSQDDWGCKRKHQEWKSKREKGGQTDMKLLRARVKKCVTVLGKERLSSFCILVCKFECSIHNFGGPFQAVMDEQCIELNRWHGGTPQSIILSHGFTFHHLVNPHTHIHTCTWSARNISGCEKEAS